jgi:hypothetical protein
MGLDNIPAFYPCIDKAARSEDGGIDCDKTQSEGNCTWKNKYENSIISKEAKPTYGMFGAACWYRGKYGNLLLSLLEYGSRDSQDVTSYSFYGEGRGEDEEGMSADYCLEMAEYMKEHTEEYAYKATLSEPESAKDLINDWIYAIWWLEFVANETDGSVVWY